MKQNEFAHALIVAALGTFGDMGIAQDIRQKVMNEKGVEFGFFCSGRYSNEGCGRTFSILWSHLLTRSSLCSQEVLRLLREATESSQALHYLWWNGGYEMSLSSAYRYRRKWLQSFGHLRAQLRRDHPPPKVNGTAGTQMIRHLRQALGEESSGWVPLFQEQYQRDFFL